MRYGCDMKGTPSEHMTQDKGGFGCWFWSCPDCYQNRSNASTLLYDKMLKWGATGK